MTACGYSSFDCNTVSGNISKNCFVGSAKVIILKHIKELDGLRGLLSVWVLFGHVVAAAPINNFLFEERLFNEYAVAIFIVMSGFVIALVLDGRPQSYKQYLKRRFLRIFPAYWFYLAISIAIAPIALDTWLSSPDGSMRASRIEISADTMQYYWQHFAAHVTALHGAIPRNLLPSTDYAFLGQAWSVSIEWQFYLIAPFVIFFLRTPQSVASTATMTAFLLGLVVVAIVMPTGFVGRWVLPFSVGIGSFYAFKHFEAFIGVHAAKLTVLALVLALSVRSIDAMPYAIWAIVLVSAATSRSPLSIVLNSSPLQNLGKISYSVYLSHMIVLVFAIRWLPEITSPTAHFLALLFTTAVFTGTISMFSYLFIEQPFQKVGRRKAAPPIDAVGS